MVNLVVCKSIGYIDDKVNITIIHIFVIILVYSYDVDITREINWRHWTENIIIEKKVNHIRESRLKNIFINVSNGFTDGWRHSLSLERPSMEHLVTVVSRDIAYGNKIIRNDWIPPIIKCTPWKDTNNMFIPKCQNLCRSSFIWLSSFSLITLV